jgi:hypothetical protein
VEVGIRSYFHYCHLERAYSLYLEIGPLNHHCVLFGIVAILVVLLALSLLEVSSCALGLVHPSLRIQMMTLRLLACLDWHFDVCGGKLAEFENVQTDHSRQRISDRQGSCAHSQTDLSLVH